MGGLIHHLIAGTISAAIIYYLFRRKDFALAVFAGNLLPDFVGAAYAAVLIQSIDPAVILKSAPWFSFEKDRVIQFSWIGFQAAFIAAFLFFHTKVRRRKTHYEREGNIAMLLIGFMTHMIMDIYIIESGVFL